MKFNVITIFPKIMDSYLKEGIIGRAIENKKIKVKAHNLRDFTLDKHKTVDDTIYGGGAGMLLKVEPLYRAIKKISGKKGQTGKKIVLLSAQGKKWDQDLVKKYSKMKELTLICGRYEGVDERIKNFIDEEVSLGDYILSGGELGALIMIDSISRLIPGVLGNQASLDEESHNSSGLLEYPQYTKPEIFKAGKKEYPVPEILLSGHHQKIEKWRQEQARKRRK